MKWHAPIRRLLRSVGYDVVRAHLSPTARRMSLLERYQVDLILDVGANKGQYATQLREMGYRGTIVSFEPLDDAFALLEQKAKSDPRWHVVQLALGDFDGDSVINVSASNVNSSILPLSDRLKKMNNYAVTQQQKITVRRLDSIAPDYLDSGARIFLKIDTQGYEQHVLDGAAKTLERVIGVQMEMSFIPLYTGELPINEHLNRLTALGFTLMSTEHAFSDMNSRRQYQMDGIFFREPFP